jgi:RNA-directed DNA polymerase
MKSVARRVSDAAMLRLVKAWLEMAVEETNERGNKRRTTVNKDRGKGTPQGAPISPLLANLYMRRFLLGWKQQGWEQRLQAHIVNYADDFVILSRRKAAEAQAQMANMMEKLKLEVNQQKTRVCRVPKESFDFLGYTLGRCYRVKTGQAYIGTKPSKKRVLRVCESISQKTDRKTCGGDTKEVIGELNQMLRGWANYFQLGSVSKAYESVDSHVRHRLRHWLRRKHKIKVRVEKDFTDDYLYQQLGLIRLTHFQGNLPWAKAK